MLQAVNLNIFIHQFPDSDKPLCGLLVFARCCDRRTELTDGFLIFDFSKKHSRVVDFFSHPLYTSRMNGYFVVHIQIMGCQVTEQDITNVRFDVVLNPLLRIGRNNMYRLVNSGQIQSIKVGRKILIPRNALVRFLSAFDQAS